MFRELKKKTKKIPIGKKVQNLFFLAPPISFVPFIHPYISKSTNNFEKKIIYPLDLEE